MQPLTTNALEGYHRSINNSFRTANPNLARFLDFLQKEVRRIKFKVEEAANGKLKRKCKEKYTQLFNILNCYESYTESEILCIIATIIEIKSY
jgi:hypothetical protein